MATKKISELPLVNRVSGSQVAGGSVLPIVIGGGIQGTTNQISVENFSLFVNAYNATTASNTFIGTQNVTGDVNISGRLTVREVVAQYETASILFSTGSTKLGDELTDKHEFTGSTNIIGSISVNGNLSLNGVSLNNSFDRLHQATQSLELFTSSQAARNLVLSTVTGSINQATASIQFQTASLLQFTASQDSRNFTLSQVTGSFNYFYQATASIQFQTASLLQFTASQDSRNFTLSQVTASFNYFYQATASLQTFTSSQADRNLVLSIVTGSINQATESLQFQSASVNAQLGRIQQATASLELASASFKYFYQSTASLQTFTASQADRNLVLSIVTGSINQATASIQFQTASLLAFTASQDNRNLTLSTVTGSLIGITNGLMAFTAALDNTYATDAQLYQLYQSTRSLELHSGSMVGVTNGLMAYTASNSTLNTGLRGEVDGIEAYTASLKGQAIVSSSTQVRNYDVFALNSNLFTATGSLIGITNGLMAFTAALDSTYATDAQLYQLYAETASIKAEIAGIEALTASFKAAAIVSSSTQISNYYKFAETASANTTFYGGINVTDYSKFGKTGVSKALDIFGGISVTGSVITQQNTIGSFVGSYYTQWDSFGSQGGDGNASVGYFVGTFNDDRKLRLLSDADILLTHGINKKIQVAKASIGTSKVEITGSFNVTGSSTTVGDLIVTLGGITGSILATNGVLSGSAQIGELTQIAGIEAYTASLKGAAIVSSSQQITNYYKFAETASASTTFYGSVTASAFNVSTFGGTTDIYHTGGGHTVIKNTTTNKDINYQTVGTGEHYFNSDVNITNGNLVFDNGKGIDFSATANSGSSVQSEILNDYEAGSWTPTVEAVTGTYTTVTNQRGTYTKIGRLVTVHFYFIVSNKGTGAGGFNITNLPYPVLPMSAGDAYIGSGINTSNSIMFNIQAIQGTTTCSGYRYDGTDSIIATNGNNGTVTYITYP
jgi:hypothetical protein